mgnify:CR=1 FL=1|jgi:tetratricopeptide (TPR) repeat protein
MYRLLHAAGLWALLIAGGAQADEAIWRNHMATAAEAAKRSDHAAAVQLYEAALRQTGGFAPDDARVAATIFGLAQAQRAQYDYAAAEKNYLRALGLLETAASPSEARNTSLAGVLNALGDLFRVQGRHADAEMYYRRELTIIEQTQGSDSPAVAQALSNNFAALYRAQGRRSEAEAAYKRAFAILEKSAPADDPRLGFALIDLAEWYQGEQRPAEAEPYYRRGIPIVEKTLPPAHPRLLNLLQDWGVVTQLQGRYKEAEAVYRMLLSLIERTYGADHPNVAFALNNFVGLYEVQGRQSDANAVRKRMLALNNAPLRTQPYVPEQGVPRRR